VTHRVVAGSVASHVIAILCTITSTTDPKDTHMPLNNRTARVGSSFTLDGNTFTVHTISPAGSTGLSFAHGPVIGGHIRPGGFGVTIDESTPGVEWNEPAQPAQAAQPVDHANTDTVPMDLSEIHAMSGAKYATSAEY
jgi:hypothetical protein